MKNNIHANHRQRMKNKFINASCSIDSFAEHEILELLLYYSIPQADTNPLAHKLISKYGSLKNVLESNIDNLKSTPGVGEHTAVLLKLIPAISNFCNIQYVNDIKTINNQLVAKDYISHLFQGVSHEEFYVICLRANGEIIDKKKLSTGDSTKVEVKLRAVTDFALKNDCERIIVAHNHPHTKSKPSDEDIVMTHKLFSSCVLNDIDVLDHIIYSPFGCYSFAETDILLAIKKDVLNMLKINIDSERYKKFSASIENYVIKQQQ